MSKLKAIKKVLAAIVDSRLSGYFFVAGVTYGGLEVLGQWAYTPLSVTAKASAAIGLAAGVACIVRFVKDQDSDA